MKDYQFFGIAAILLVMNSNLLESYNGNTVSIVGSTILSIISAALAGYYWQADKAKK